MLSPQIPIDHVLEHLLPTRCVGRSLALLQHVRLQLLEVRLSGFDLFADTLVPGCVALFDEILEDAILADFGGQLQSRSG